MLITFALIGASCVSVTNTHVGSPGHSHNTQVNVEVLGEDWSSEEQNMDHLVRIDFNLVLDVLLRLQVGQLTSWITLIVTWRVFTVWRNE